MKNFLTLLVFLMMASFTLQAQTLIWGGPDDPNGSFDGGLNDWTVIPISVATGTVDSALWKWAPNGSMPDTGAYYGDRGPITSESADNGAASFNSDFLDNNGTRQPNSGVGPAGGPQESYLLSPEIDISGQNDVNLTFTNYFRNFQTEARVSILTDGSATPDSTIVVFSNDEDVALVTIATQNETDTDENVVIDISSIVAGKSTMRIRFEWSGNYYFWILDDVALITKPRNDLRVVSNFFPPANSLTPSCLLKYDPFGFSFAVRNDGAAAQTNVTGYAYVFESVTGQDPLVYVDSVNAGTLNPGDTAFIEFPLWAAEDLSEGTYYVQYLVSQDDADYTPANNLTGAAGHSFTIDSDALDKTNDETPGIAYQWTNAAITDPNTNEQSWTVVASYDIPDYEDCLASNGDSSIVKYSAVSIRHSHTDGGAPIANAEVEFSAYEIDTSVVGSDFSDLFDPDQDLRSKSLFDLSDEDIAKFLFIDFFELQEGNFTTHSYDIDPIELEKGKRYWLAAKFFGTAANPNTLSYFSGAEVDSKVIPAYQVFLFIDNSGTPNWFYTSNAMNLGFNLSVDLVSDNTDVLLPANTFTLSPNLVSSEDVRVNFDLETPTTGHITIYDEMGRVSYLQEHRGLTNESIVLPTAQLSSGTYHVLFQSEAGILTKKFVVSK